MQAKLIVDAISLGGNEPAGEILLHQLLHVRAQLQGSNLHHHLMVLKVDRVGLDVAVATVSGSSDWLQMCLLVGEPKG